MQVSQVHAVGLFLVFEQALGSSLKLKAPKPFCCFLDREVGRTHQ